MTTATQQSAPPTLALALISAGGYFAVAIACAWAGYALGHHHILVAVNDLPVLVLAIAALFPAYVNRGILYELKHSQRFSEDDQNRLWLKKLSIQLPLLIAIVVLGGAVVVSRSTSTPIFWRTCLHILITVAPIYVMGIRLTSRWLRDENVFAFRFRSFFPAFATCLMPFTFGYGNFAEVVCSTTAAVLIIGYWLVALHASTRTGAIIGMGILITIVGWQIAVITLMTTQADCARVLFFGTVMTLLMGVSESWRVTTRILNDHDFRLSAYSEEEKKFYLGGTNIGTALFIPFFLLTFLHSSTTPLYLFLFLILLAVQYTFWFVDRTPQKSTLWPMAGVACGLLVPIMIGICTHVAGRLELPKFRFVPHELGSLVEVIGANVALAGFLTHIGVRHIMKRRKSYPTGSYLVCFLTPFPCICVTGVLSAAFSILITCYGFSFNFVPETEARLAALIFAYSSVSGLCALALTINSIANKMSNKSEPALGSSLKDESLNKEVGARYTKLIPEIMRAMWGLTRPLPSLIAGLLTALVAQHGGLIFALRAGTSMTLVVMFGFVIDNICDFDGDRLAGVRTPLTSRIISISGAKGAAVCLGILALVLSPSLRASCVILAPTMLALILYPLFSHKFPLLKGAYTSCLVCLPLLYPSFMTGNRIPIRYYLLLFVFILAREALIDAYQSSTDKKVGRNTVAVVWGKETIERCAGYAILITAGLLIVIAQGPVAKALAVTCLLTVAIILYSPLVQNRRAGWLRVSMIFGAIALALSVA